MSTIRGQRVAAFCGIGNPAGFRHTLSQCEVEIAALQEFPDHYNYAPQRLQVLEAWLATAAKHRKIAAVLCTRKDLVKIPHQQLAGVPLLAVEVEVEITRGRLELEGKVAKSISQYGCSPLE